MPHILPHLDIIAGRGRIGPVAGPGFALPILGALHTSAARLAPAQIAGVFAGEVLSDPGALLYAVPPMPVPMQDALSCEPLHRMANSVQIIASLLRYSLRESCSDEARREINGAYLRIMAVAALERALFDPKGQVGIADHLNGLLRRFVEAFLPETRRISVGIRCGPVMLDAATATDLGLVLTELLINAVKHAIPDDRGGRISIAFQTTPQGWRLSVCDDGIGRAVRPAAGLGSSIMQALATRLQAELTVRDVSSGTRIVLRHPRL